MMCQNGQCSREDETEAREVQEARSRGPIPQHPSREERPAGLGVETSLGPARKEEPVCTCKTVCFGSSMLEQIQFVLVAVSLKLFMESTHWGCKALGVQAKPMKAVPGRWARPPLIPSHYLS